MCFRVEDGNAAAVAGLQVQDELLAIGGVELSGYRGEAVALISKMVQDQKLTVLVRRKVRIAQKQKYGGVCVREREVFRYEKRIRNPQFLHPFC